MATLVHHTKSEIHLMEMQASFGHFGPVMRNLNFSSVDVLVSFGHFGPIGKTLCCKLTEIQISTQHNSGKVDFGPFFNQKSIGHFGPLTH